MRRIIEVRPEEGFRIRIKFSDGKEGIVDLSDMVGRGIFSRWNDKKYFDSVYVDRESHTVAWPGGIDLDPDALYADVTGENISASLMEKVPSA